MPASAETRAAADLVRAEQLVALAGAQPVAAPIDYNVPYSPAPVAPPVAPVAPPPISPTLPQPGEPGSENYYGNDPSLGPVDPGAPNYSVVTGGPQDVASSGNTYPVGAGPYPTLEAGIYQGNYFGNDPTLGLTSQDVPSYTLLQSEGDAISSGNTYPVGLGPRPGLEAGVYPVGSSAPSTVMPRPPFTAGQPPISPGSLAPMSGLRLPPVAAPQPVNEASAQTGDLAFLPDRSPSNLEPLYWSAPDEHGNRYQITKAKSDYFMGMQSGTEGRTLGGAREATGLANLEYQLAGGVPGSSRRTGMSPAEMGTAAITGLGAGGPAAILGIVRAALAAGASIPAIAARLGMSAAELKLTLAEFAAGAGIIGASEAVDRPEGMQPSIIRRAIASGREWLDGDEDGSSAAAEDLPQPRGEQPRSEVAEGPADVERERGGLAGLADRGRHGDSMLVHMAPEEVAGLASLTPNGVTINPETGLPEMFNLRSILPTIITIGAGIMSGGTLSPLAAAALSGVTTAAVSEGTTSERLGKGLAAGIGSYGMGQLMGSLGSAGAAADPAAVQGVGALPQGGANLFSDGASLPWDKLTPEMRKILEQQGVSAQAYPALAKSMTTKLAAQTGQGPLQFMPQKALGRAYNPASVEMLEDISYSPWGELQEGLKVGGENVWQRPYTIGQQQAAAASALNPVFKPAQGVAVYEAAGPIDRLGYAAKGLGQVDLSSWGEAAPGKIAVGDLATPAMAATVGIGGTLPVEEYEPPARRTYDDQGPYLPAERRRRALPPGYIPGVSPQLTYFAAGTHGKTVSGGLPTIYARGGMDSPPPGHFPAYITPNEAEVLRSRGGGVAPGGGQYMANGIPAFWVGDPAEGHGAEGASSDTGAEAAATTAPDSPYGATWGGITATGPHASPTTVEPPSGMGMTGSNVTAEDIADMMGRAGELSLGNAMSLGAAKAGVVDEKGNLNPLSVISPVMSLFAAAANAPHGSLGHHGLGDPSDPDPSGEGEAIGGPGEDDLRLLAAPALPDTDEEERLVQEEEERQRMLALSMNRRFTGLPPATYRPGVDPQFSYFAQEGTEGMTIEENIDVETAAEMPAGVAATTGIMQGAPVEVQDDVEVRLSERQVEEPQNPRERAIYDRAVLALQNELEPEVAQRAIDEFLEVFGPEALHMLQEMVRGDRENGGTVETANGETTIAEGEVQGPDVIAGKIVDPVTGEETANLRVGENEYIEPADSLARRAQVAGLPPTPENGAMLRGQEERMLRQAVG